jgi:ribosomal protein S27E
MSFTRDSRNTFFKVPPDAPLEEIRAAYRRLSKNFHPDTGGSDTLFQNFQDEYKLLCAVADQRSNVSEQATKSNFATAPQPGRSKPRLEWVDVECPKCRRGQPVFVSAIRYVCKGCEISWRFARCTKCRQKSQVQETAASWNCSACGTLGLSTWDVLQAFKCTLCVTTLYHPRSVKRFACFRCLSRYSYCERCTKYSLVKVPAGERKLRCSSCGKRHPL